jgi:hypothetical protein
MNLCQQQTGKSLFCLQLGKTLFLDMTDILRQISQEYVTPAFAEEHDADFLCGRQRMLF